MRAEVQIFRKNSFERMLRLNALENCLVCFRLETICVIYPRIRQKGKAEVNYFNRLITMSLDSVEWSIIQKDKNGTETALNVCTLL